MDIAWSDCNDVQVHYTLTTKVQVALCMKNLYSNSHEVSELCYFHWVETKYFQMTIWFLVTKKKKIHVAKVSYLLGEKLIGLSL